MGALAEAGRGALLALGLVWLGLGALWLIERALGDAVVVILALMGAGYVIRPKRRP